MVIMKIFSTSQNGSTPLSTHISSKWTFLSNEINSACRSAIRHVRSLARRRDSRNEENMNAPPTYHSLLYSPAKTDKKTKTPTHMGVTAPVLARKAMGFVGSSNMSWIENETISTQLVTAEEQTEKTTHSDMAPVKISWRVNKTENTASCNNETVTTQDNQTEEQAKRAGRLDVNSLLPACVSNDTDTISLAEDDTVVTEKGKEFKKEILLHEQNQTAKDKKKMRKRLRYLSEEQDFLKNEIKKCSKILDDIPEDVAMKRFCRTKKRASMAERKWICERYSPKSPESKKDDSSPNKSSSSSTKTALPAFHKDLPTSSPMCSIEQGKAPVSETANNGEFTSQSKDGIEVSPAKGEQLAATMDQVVADRLDANKHIGTGCLTTNDTISCLLTQINGKETIGPEKQKVAQDKNEVLSGQFKSQIYTLESSVACEETALPTSVEPSKKPDPSRRLSQFVASSMIDHNNNGAKP